MTTTTLKDFRALLDDGDHVYLTTEHAASSYGQPVLVLGGEAFGPGDMIALAGGAAGYQSAADYVRTEAAIERLQDDALVVKFCA